MIMMAPISPLTEGYGALGSFFSRSRGGLSPPRQLCKSWENYGVGFPAIPRHL
jgi:hypothetical protein